MRSQVCGNGLFSFRIAVVDYSATSQLWPVSPFSDGIGRVRMLEPI